jgi:tRNA (guanine37-N1)-methyltransferase
MAVPCVQVPSQEGERTRQSLAERDVIDESHEIVHEGGRLYIPVTDETAVSAEYDVVYREVPRRETQTMPADLVDFSPSYARLGDIVIVDEDDPDRASELAGAIVESAIPTKTVLNRASKIRGETRVRDWAVLAGEETETVHREYGWEFALDLERVYFSPRLATERHRVIEQVQGGEHVFDMFAGVGPFAVPMAGRGAAVVGTDINETAVKYMRENARRNGVADDVTAIHGNVREIAPDYTGWADRIVMNLPHSADDFLPSALTIAGKTCTIHYYDITHESDRYGPGERAIREAADGVYDVSVETRRTVRSYAPREYNVALDVRLSHR